MPCKKNSRKTGTKSTKKTNTPYGYDGVAAHESPARATKKAAKKLKR